MTVRRKNEGRVYLRRSTTKQAMGIHDQLRWAIREAAQRGITLDASLADLEHMLLRGLKSYKHIYLDDGVSGSDLTRRGFLAFRGEALGNHAVSHVFVHMSDRFARPDQSLQAMQLEHELLYAGITVVFSNRVAEPRSHGRGHEYISQDLTAYLEYSANGDYLNKLAVRVLQAQIQNAKEGFRTGGYAPYGFIRILVDSAGRELEELPDGKTVRQHGCHVMIRPKDMMKIQVWLLILHLYGVKRIGLQKICNHLDQLGIPSPHAGKLIKQGGRLVPCSGKWNRHTVARLIDDEDIIGVASFGHVSSGNHRRYDPDDPTQPRLVNDADRSEMSKSKKVTNPSERIIRAPAGHEGIAAQEVFASCQKLRKERAKDRRGITRLRDPGKYPLSTHIFDLTTGCGKPLYGRLTNKRATYVCSRYMRTGGQDCAHNSVDAETALGFIVATLREKGQWTSGRELLRAKLRELAAKEINAPPHELMELSLAEKQLSSARSELAVMKGNLARSTGDAEVFATISTEFKTKKREVEQLENQIKSLRVSSQAATVDPDSEVEAAMSLLDEFEKLTTDPIARNEIPALLRKLEVKIGLYFSDKTRPSGKRTRVVHSGVLTIGSSFEDKPVEESSDGFPPQDAGADYGGAITPPIRTSKASDGKCSETGNCFTIGTSGEPSGTGLVRWVRTIFSRGLPGPARLAGPTLKLRNMLVCKIHSDSNGCNARPYIRSHRNRIDTSNS